MCIRDSLRITDTDFRNDLDEIRVNVEQAERVKLRVNGCGTLVLLWILSMLVGAGAGILLVASGAQNAAGPVSFILAIGTMVLLILKQRMPGWKWDWKQSPAYVRQTGLQ